MTTKEQIDAADQPALLACPFCGGEAHFERMGTGRVSCNVACGNCGARHESSDEYLQSGRSWNTRAPRVEGGEGAPAATNETTRTDWQARCQELGFKYWRAPDAHGVECSVEQATELLSQVLGVGVEISTEANLLAARVLRAERDQARNEKDRLFQIMMSVWNLLHPNPDGFEHEGKRYLFVDPNAAETLRTLSARILAIPEKLAAAEIGKATP